MTRLQKENSSSRALPASDKSRFRAILNACVQPVPKDRKTKAVRRSGGSKAKRADRRTSASA